MTTPSINDYVLKTNKPLTAADWENNLQTTVNYLTDGAADLSINSLAMVGALSVGTNITATNVTATNLYGDGSGIVGLDVQNKNWLVNGDGMVNTLAQFTLSLNNYSDLLNEGVNCWQGMATGTAVTAGSFTNTASSNVGRNGYAFIFLGATLTGAGVINLRYRMNSKDAKNFIGQIASFGSLVYHNVGSNINYTVTISKANALNDFTAVTAISSSAALAVVTGTPTAVKLENVSMGACGNGIQIIISAAAGAITTKNFEFANLQLEISPSATGYEYRIYQNEYTLTTKTWRLAYEKTISGAVSSFLVSGIPSGDSATCYKIILHVKAGAAAATSYYCQPNNDGGANYCRQIISFFSSTVGSSQSLAASDGLVVGYTAGLTNLSLSETFMYAISGSTRLAITNILANADGSSLTGALNEYQTWGSAADIASFSFEASEVSGFGVGTFVQIWVQG